MLLAACRDDEEAKEYQGGGATRGAFSYFLGETLRTAGGGISYRSLFDRAAARSAARSRGRHPSSRPPQPGTSTGPSSAA